MQQPNQLHSGVYMLKASYNDNGDVDDFIIIHVNDAVCRISGKCQEELFGKKLTETFANIIESGIMERNKNALQSGKAFHSEFCYEEKGIAKLFKRIYQPFK